MFNRRASHSASEYTPLLSASSLPSVFTDPAGGYLTDDATIGPTGAIGEDAALERDLLGGSGGALEGGARVGGEVAATTRGRRVRRRAGGGGHRHSSRQRGRKRRRVRSETDLRKMRPFIASPFMPLATQVSIDVAAASASHRRSIAISNAAPAQSSSSAAHTATTSQRRSVARPHAAAASASAAAATTSAMTIDGSAVPLALADRARYGTLPLKKAPGDGPTSNATITTTTTTAAGEQGQQVERADGESSSSADEESESDEEDESSTSSESSIYTRFSDLTRKQWATVGMLAIANLCSTVAFSCIAPFYPVEAKRKGMSQSQIGIVFGIFELVMFVTAPILGKYMSVLGSKRMFSTGIFVTGTTAIAFGFLIYLPSEPIFFWASLLVRCLEALGDACFVTSSFAISAKCFPGRIATIVGIMETFAGLGYTAGPVIGGVLYEWGGFKLPFFALGVTLIVATVVSYYLVDEVEDEESDDAMGMVSMLRIPVIWLMVFAVVICAISLSFFDPTLADELAPFNLSTTGVGLMFLLCGGIYTLTAPLWGCLLDRWNCCNLLMFFGSAATVVSMLLIGPSPLLFNFEKNLLLMGISLAILGVSAGALYIPTFQNCLDAVKDNGYDDSFQTYGCVSGVFQSAFALGAFLGPTIGSVSVQKIGFAWTTSIIAAVNLVFIFTLVVFLSTRACITRSVSSPYRRKEHEPLAQA